MFWAFDLLHLMVSFNALVKRIFQITRLLIWSRAVVYRIWNVEAMMHSACKILPHPSFVYAAKYHVDVGNLVVTGGFDRLVRVWNLQSKGSTAHVWLLFFCMLEIAELQFIRFVVRKVVIGRQ